MFLDQVFLPDPMEKDLSPLDLYKGVTEDSLIHARCDTSPTLKSNIRPFQSSELKIKIDN